MDQYFVYGTASIIIGLIVWHLARRTLDPFAPIWLFLAGYFQIYVVQALAYREYALQARGLDIVTEANGRALWALIWFLAVYYCGIGRYLASKMPRAPGHWSPGFVCAAAPPMIAWGLICCGLFLSGDREAPMTAEENLLRQFPIFMLAAGVMLLVTGRQPTRPRPLLTWAGLMVIAMYSLIWMFNGKRSHSLIAVLTGVCAFYVPRGKKPSFPVLAVTGLTCALVVSVALGWRSNYRYERSVAGFGRYLADFQPETILVNLNMREAKDVDPQAGEIANKETEEYGGYLLMLDTVPMKSSYDYGESYLRLYSTYIPRILWADKPFYGRQQWINAWIAGSAFRREAWFTGPAIGVLGAAQLNGGAVATVLLLAVLGVVQRTAYEYFRRFAFTPWAQVWWPLTYYNAWLMTANDDPFVWFYYIYGHTILPPMFLLWFYHRVSAPKAEIGATASADWRGSLSPGGAH